MISTELTMKKEDSREMSNFVLFLLGKLVSMFGSSVYTFTIGLYVLKLTGSGLSFATNLVLGTIPMIVINPIAGVLADRFDKKKLVVGMDLANGFLLIIIYYLSLNLGLNLTMIYLSTFIMNIFTSIFGISFEAAIPNIVSEKKLMNINSFSKIIDSVSSILGPMIGGIVFAFIDIKAFILINGISFIFSGISEMFIDFKLNYTPEDKVEERAGFVKDIKEGFRYLIERKDIINIVAVLVIVNFFLGFCITIPIPFIINNVLKLGSRNFGIIEGAFPVGMIAGALVVKKIIERISFNKLLAYASYGMAACMLLTGVPVLLVNMKPDILILLVYYSIVMTALGVMISLVDIPLSYMLQKLVPDDYRGRVLSIGISIAKIILPVALIISGSLLNIIPSYILPMAGGMVFFLIILFNVKVL